MRKLMWFTIGFGFACGIGVYLDPETWLVPLALTALFCTVGMWFLMQWQKHCRVGIALFLGMTLGFGWFFAFDLLYLSDAKNLDGKEATVEIRMTDYGWKTDYGTANDGEMVLDGKSYQVRLYLNEEAALLPGDRVRGTFRFQTTTGGEETTFHRGEGIFLLAYQRGAVEYDYAEYLDSQDLPTYLRYSLTNLVEGLFPADTSPFAKALLLGDDTDLDYETETALKVSGIRHVVAVSGLHVSILFTMISYMTGRKRFVTALLGIPVLILFAAVVGFTPSVTRACAMQCLMMLGAVFRRDYDPPTALSFSALVMLAVNPIIITSISFQMSVCCIAGIFAFYEKLRDWLMDEKRLGKLGPFTLWGKAAKWFAGSVSVSLAASILTTPLAALYFGTVSLVSILTNLLTLWVVNVVFFGIMLTCGLGLVWLGAGRVLADVLSWGVRYILWMANLMESIRFGAVFTASDSVVVWIVLAYAVLVACFLLKMKHKTIIGCILMMGLCVCFLVSWIRPLGGECCLTVLDVGQGQCVLLQSEGKTFMVDCGGSYDESTADLAAETILSQGISRLDGLIVTHYDRDHAGGVEFFLTRIPTAMLLLPDVVDEDGVKDGILEQAQGREVLVADDLRISYGSTKMTVFGPMEGKTGNESSMCVLFQTENCDILITGDNSMDGERRLLERTKLPRLEVLIVGHHGSKYSTSPELLEATKPAVAIISVDANNSYGHPTQEVLDRLAECGCTIYRTDLDGTVVYRG